MKLSYISIPMLTVHTITPTNLSVSSPRKTAKSSSRLWGRAGSTISWIALLALFGSVSILKSAFSWHSSDLIHDSCFSILPSKRLETYHSALQEIAEQRPLVPPLLASNLTSSRKLFRKNSNGLDYQPCIEFSRTYKAASSMVLHSKRKYLIVVVNGGLNQQRNQIVDAVVIARILGAALVLPILQVNRIWEDESEFSDIFDVEHFKRTLKDDLLIVSSLPSTLVMSKPVESRDAPLNSSPEWFRSNYANKFNRGGILLLRSLDSRLSKDLPIDLQKLRCKVAFHALRFAAPIQALGDTLARRIARQGPYVALHLRMERDVWIRTGCSSGLGPSFDAEVEEERIQKPQFLTTRNNMTYADRRRAGQCPLNAEEIVRLLSALGATEHTTIFWAGGEPFGGGQALQPLIDKFPLLYNKGNLAFPEELNAFKTRASMLAAIDYIVCLNSNLFIPSHGGNMGRAIKGNRIYAGHKKNVTPNKRLMLEILDNTTVSREEADQSIAELHIETSNQLILRTDKKGLDVLAYPMPECMCQREKQSTTSASI